MSSSCSSSSPLLYIGSIDQGTSSSRFILFDSFGSFVDSHQIELTQIHPSHHPGWSEHDPDEIWQSVRECIRVVMQRNEGAKVAALGISNQRETTIVWDSETGRPLHNAIVWHDSRTDSICSNFIHRFDGNKDHFRPVTGLPISTYFSAFKVVWLLSNVPAIQSAVASGSGRFGTVDSWLIWNLTREHVTDVTNASRTCLMDLKTRDWDVDICVSLGLPHPRHQSAFYPRIRSSAEVYGQVVLSAFPEDSLLLGVPVAGCLGDQQAALVGQLCFEPGTAKSTYGTGCFLLMNTGPVPVPSKFGLLTTVGFQLGASAPTIYALEGSVAVSGAGVRWLRDELKMIGSAAEINKFALESDDTNGVYFVPAFSGLLSPYWRPDARGLIIGLTHSSNKSHICRAVLESSAYQAAEVLSAMEADSDIKLHRLRVDGGLCQSDYVMQFQSDLLNLPVVKPANLECTAAGAAFAAGLAVGYWKDQKQLVEKIERAGAGPKIFESKMKPEERERLVNGWKKAVERTFGWIETEGESEGSNSRRGGCCGGTQSENRLCFGLRAFAKTVSSINFIGGLGLGVALKLAWDGIQARKRT